MNDQAAPPTATEIGRRLRTVTELRNLCLSLGRAGGARLAAVDETAQRRKLLPPHRAAPVSR